MILVICWGKWVLSRTINLGRFINLGGTFQAPICSQHLELIPWIEWKIPLLLQSHSLLNVSHKRLPWAALDLDFPNLCLGPSFPKPRLCFNGNISSGSRFLALFPAGITGKILGIGIFETTHWHCQGDLNPLCLMQSLSPQEFHGKINGRGWREELSHLLSPQQWKAQGILQNIPASPFPEWLDWKWEKAQVTPKIFQPQLPWDAWNGSRRVNRGMGILDKSAHFAPKKRLYVEQEPGQAWAWGL